MQVGHGLPQSLRDADRVRGQAVLEQHAEFVASETRERVALAQPFAQHEAHLPHQLVARGVPRRVVDELELIEIEIEHRVMPAVLARAGKCEVEPALELASVDEPGERVVACLIGELRRVVALLADIAQHQHGAVDPRRRIAERNGRCMDRDLGAVAAAEEHAATRPGTRPCGAARAGSDRARRRA